MTRLIVRCDMARTGSRQGFHLHARLDMPGQGIIAVFGRSGSGKTTLLRCLAGLERSPSGFVSINGTVWQDASKGIFTPVHQRGVGMVFQQPCLFPHLKVRANLNYGLKRTLSSSSQRHLPWDHVIDMLGIGALLDRYPQHLSMGEQQRVSIGRAVLGNPCLLLMDEPLASLDAQRKDEILPFIKRLNREMNIPVMYVSHSVQEIVQIADTLILVNEGQATIAGSIHEIFSRLNLAECLGFEHLGEITGAVIDTHVVAHEPEFGLTCLEFHGRRLYVSHQPLSIGDPLRIHILSRNVSLSLAPPQAPTSVLNIIEAQVVEIGAIVPEKSAVEVKLDAGCPLLATITRKSLHALALSPGQRVYASIKTVSLQS